MITIIDSNAILNRYYYAYQTLTHQSQSVGGIYGFVNFIYSLFYNRRQDEFFVFVWDAPACSYRKRDIYSNYKGNRIANPELHNQKLVIQDIMKILDFQQFQVDREEADDTIATIANQARKLKQKVTIYSRDHDFEQLITPAISILYYDKKQIYIRDIDYIKQKYGLDHPSQLKDVLILSGDVRDNVPGVFGPITALKLIQANKSLFNIQKNIRMAKMFNRKGDLSIVSKTIATKLEKGQDIIRLNEQLVVLKNNLDFDFVPQKSISPDWISFEEFMYRLDFRSIIARINKFKNYLKYC